MEQALTYPEYIPIFQQLADQGLQTWAGHGGFVLNSLHSGFPFHDILQLYFEHTLRSSIDGDKYSQWKSGSNSVMTNSALFWKFHIKLSMHFFNLS